MPRPPLTLLPDPRSVQPHDEAGRFQAPDEATVQRQKTVLLGCLALGMNLKEAVAQSGISYWTFWYRASRGDEELATALETWRKSLGLESLAAIQADMANPDDSRGLQSKGANAYANFRMFTAKASFPDMRDSAPIVNVDARTLTVGAGDLAGVVAQLARQRETGQLPEPEAD